MRRKDAPRFERRADTTTFVSTTTWYIRASPRCYRARECRSTWLAGFGGCPRNSGLGKLRPFSSGRLGGVILPQKGPIRVAVDSALPNFLGDRPIDPAPKLLAQT